MRSSRSKTDPELWDISDTDTVLLLLLLLQDNKGILCKEIPQMLVLEYLINNMNTVNNPLCCCFLLSRNDLTRQVFSFLNPIGDDRFWHEINAAACSCCVINISNKTLTFCVLILGKARLEETEQQIPDLQVNLGRKY